MHVISKSNHLPQVKWEINVITCMAVFKKMENEAHEMRNGILLSPAALLSSRALAVAEKII